MKQSSKALKARTQQQGAAKKAAAGTARHDREHGEGNYKAAREYDRATGAYARSGKVEAAARAARPGSPREAEEMERAEAAGKSRSKGEDAPRVRQRR
jgi:hypothetical protein